MKQKLNIITRAIMVAFLSSVSINSYASCEEAISANYREQNLTPGQIIIGGDTIMPDSTYNWPIYEVMPSFPGGESALYEFLESNKQYPEEAKRNNEHGIVIVTFWVEKDGTITNARILRGCTPSLDAEALRLVSTMPKWTPGKMNGELKRVSFSLPIRF